MKLKIMNQEQIEKFIFRGTFIVMIFIVVIGLILLLSEMGIIRNESQKLIFTNSNFDVVQNTENFENPSLSENKLDI